MEQTGLFKNVQQHKDALLSERVAQQISDLIKEQDIQVGDKLPNEFELAQSLNVGRSTIREAVKLLVARNCLEIRRGRGTFVTQDPGRVEDPLGFDYVEDKVKLAEELYEIRIQMEPWIASLAAKRIREDEKEVLMERCQAVEEMIQAGQDHNEADNAFHLYIAQCTHNSILPEILPIITYSVRLFTRLRERSLLDMTLRAHRAVVEAICANDENKAREAMHEHVYGNLYNIQMLKENSQSKGSL